MRNFFETKIKVVVVSALVFILGANLAFADALSDLQNQRSALQDKLAQIQNQQNAYQAQIQKNQKSQASLKNEISIYNAQINSTDLQLQAKRTQIEDANLQIQELQIQIDRRTKEIEDNKKVLGQLIVQLNEIDGNSVLQMSLGNGNFSDFLDQVQYTENVQGKVYQIVQNIKAIKQKLEGQQADLKVQLTNLEELKNQLQITQQALQSQRQQKDKLLSQTKGLEKNYQKLLSTSKNQEADLQAEIEGLDNSIRAKLGQRSISPSSGVLAWPMDGVITQGYGNTGFRALGYNFHNGIDIAAPVGTPIYAAADGIVNGSGSGEAAYGNWVAIKHAIVTKSGIRQIVSLYAHMRSYKVRLGQTVKQGDLIGYEGNTGNTTRLLYGPERGYHLHFTVFDAEGFGIAPGQYSNIYGNYFVPFGYTYNPMPFLQK